MKKYLGLFLALVMIFSLTACGQKGGESASAPESGEKPASSGTSNSGTAAPGSNPADIEFQTSSDVVRETLEGPFGTYVRYTTPHTSDEAMRDPTTLSIGMATPIESGNPHKGNTSTFYDLVFDKLIEYDLDTGELKGVIFKEYEMSPDNSYLTFTMYDNIYFHDGTHATAEDVLYTLERMTDSTLSPLANSTVFKNIDLEKSEITGDYSGKIVLINPSVTFVPGLTKCWLLCKSHIEKMGEDNAWWDNTVGTGPYKVESIVQGDRYNLVKNDNYWTGEKCTFDKVVVRYYAERATMLMDFETGYIEMFDDCTSAEVEMITSGQIPNAICELYPMLNVYNVVFNEEINPVLYDENVRKAICLAIDTATVNDFSWEVLGRPASSVVSSSLPDWKPTAYEQNIEEAKAALAAAGYKPGELQIIVGAHSGVQISRAAESIQNQLIEAGFDAKLLVHEATAYIQNMRNTGQDYYDLAIGSSMYEDLNSTALLSSVSHTLGNSGMTPASDPAIDELVKKATEATSVEEKEQIMKDIQDYLHDHYWMIPLVEPTTAVVYKDYLTGVRVLNPRMPDIMKIALVG